MIEVSIKRCQISECIRVDCMCFSESLSLTSGQLTGSLVRMGHQAYSSEMRLDRGVEMQQFNVEIHVLAHCQLLVQCICLRTPSDQPIGNCCIFHVASVAGFFVAIIEVLTIKPTLGCCSLVRARPHEQTKMSTEIRYQVAQIPLSVAQHGRVAVVRVEGVVDVAGIAVVEAAKQSHQCALSRSV